MDQQRTLGPDYLSPQVEQVENAPVMAEVQPPQQGNLPQIPSSSSLGGILLSKLVWLLVMLVFLGTVRIVGPHLVEIFAYSQARGKQRAEHEIATVALKGKPLEQISWASQLVSQRVLPSVVVISTSTEKEATLLDDGVSVVPKRQKMLGQGSGIILDAEEGYILTNYHVIGTFNEIRVKLSDGRNNIKAVRVGVDPLTDLAVLKIEAKNLIAMEWGDSEKQQVGSLVWALGSPFGLEKSLTFGILSAKHRAGRAGTQFQDYLQTDAAVNPGNSGGPLVDVQGRLIGINTAIVGETYQGVSFAVPSSIAKDVFERIKKDRSVIRGWLGIALGEVTPEVAEQLDLPEAKGVLVTAVVQDSSGSSPALRAGILDGDVVISWNNARTDTPASLSLLVAKTKVGSKSQLGVIRDGKLISLTVTVGRRPEQLN